MWRFQAVEPIASAQGPGLDGSGTARDRARSPLTRVEVQVLLRDFESFLTLPLLNSNLPISNDITVCLLVCLLGDCG